MATICIVLQSGLKIFVTTTVSLYKRVPRQKMRSNNLDLMLQFSAHSLNVVHRYFTDFEHVFAHWIGHIGFNFRVPWKKTYFARFNFRAPVMRENSEFSFRAPLLREN